MHTGRMGIPMGVVSVEAPVAGSNLQHCRGSCLRTSRVKGGAPLSSRALGRAQDGFDWTMTSFALPAMTASDRLGRDRGNVSARRRRVASVFGGLVGDTLARFCRMHAVIYVIHGYARFGVTLQAGARKGAR